MAPSLSVVILMHDEEPYVPRVVAAARGAARAVSEDFQILVVDEPGPGAVARPVASPPPPWTIEQRRC